MMNHCSTCDPPMWQALLNGRKSVCRMQPSVLYSSQFLVALAVAVAVVFPFAFAFLVVILGGDLLLPLLLLCLFLLSSHRDLPSRLPLPLPAKLSRRTIEFSFECPIERRLRTVPHRRSHLGNTVPSRLQNLRAQFQPPL